MSLPTDEIRDANLARATRIREEVAALKCEVRAGRMTLGQAICDQRSASVEILRLAEAVPGWESSRALDFLRRVDVRSNLRVEKLTRQQRWRIHRGLADKKWVARFAA